VEKPHFEGREREKWAPASDRKCAMKNRAAVIATGLLAFALLAILATRLHLWPTRGPSPGVVEKSSSPAAAPPSPAPSPPPSITKVPDIVPGDPLDKVVKLYGPGKEEQNDEYAHTYTWELDSFRISASVDSLLRIVSVTIGRKKEPVLTPHGIVLGRDTLAVFRDKMKDRILADREHLFDGEGMWLLVEEIRSKPDEPWVATYTWSLSEADEADAKILSQEDPPTPNVFRDVPVTTYTLALARK
jgi:hypothetical protein